MKKWLKGLTSRKLLLSLLAAGVAFGNAMWAWGLTTEQVLTVIAPILAYIGVEGVADVATRVKSPTGGAGGVDFAKLISEIEDNPIYKDTPITPGQQ